MGVLLGRPIDADFSYYELTTVQYRVAGPAAWKEKIDAADWSELASLPWLTPSASPTYSALQAQLFGDKGLEMNIVVRYDNAAVGRAALQAGAGMMLVREEYAAQGEREGHLAIWPIIRTELALSVSHQSSRKDDPLVQAFIEAAKVSWPEMKLTKTAHDV